MRAFASHAECDFAVLLCLEFGNMCLDSIVSLCLRIRNSRFTHAQNCNLHYDTLLYSHSFSTVHLFKGKVEIWLIKHWVVPILGPWLGERDRRQLFRASRRVFCAVDTAAELYSCKTGSCKSKRNKRSSARGLIDGSRMLTAVFRRIRRCL